MDEQTNPQPTNDPNNPDDAANLRELALALIEVRYHDATDTNAIQLLPGQLPPDFPTPLPMPPGGRVVGSLIAARPIVVLAAEQSDEDVIAFYTEQLTTAGWATPEDEPPPRQGGFLHSGPAGRPVRHAGIFFRDAGPMLNVIAYASPRGHTVVHLSVLPENTPPMRRGLRGRQRHMHYDIFSMLPAIAPPPDSQQRQEGGGGGDDHITMSARVETDLDLAAVAAHYDAEFTRGGWQRIENGENGPVAWSTWTFADEDKEPWRAFFVILKRPDIPRNYWVQLLAEWVGKPPRANSGRQGSQWGMTSGSFSAS